jgi:tetratricopeptide (TPR) repeat protein
MDRRTLCCLGLLIAVTFAAAPPVRALLRSETQRPSLLPLGGADVGMALLVEYFNELPALQDGMKRGDREAYLKALDAFKQKVAGRYNEGTLQRVLEAKDTPARRAAVLALGLLGTMNSNKALARALRDHDRGVRTLAADAVWAVWFRGGTESQNQKLQRLAGLHDAEEALAGLNALLKEAPKFAEAYNQRAVVYYRLGQYPKSIADCERVLKLNPYHFGAQSGMAQCFMKLHKPRAALRAFRNAHRINPGLEGIEDTIRALEDVLGEEGKK